MKLRYLILILLCSPVFATITYVSQSGGSVNCGADGTQTTQAYTWVNVAAHYTAGDTIKLCGAINGPNTVNGNVFSIQASGSSGNPITFFWESNASISEPACATIGGGGCINGNGNSWLVFDGNNTTNTIINTANGGALANQVEAQGIVANPCNNCVIKNFDIEGIYVMNPPNDNTPSTFSHDPSGIYLNGSNYLITNGTVNDANHGITSAYANGDTGNVFSFLTFNHVNQGISLGNNNTNTMSNIQMHDIHIQDMSRWDNTSNHYHHDGLFWFQDSACANCITNVYFWNILADGDMGANATAWIYYNSGLNGMYGWNLVLKNTANRGGFLLEGGFTGDTNFYIVNSFLDCGAGNGNGFNYSNVVNFTIENVAMENCSTFYSFTNITGQTKNHNIYKSFASGEANSVNTGNLLANSNGSPQAGSPMIHDSSTNFLNLTSLCSGTFQPCTDYAGNARPNTTFGWDAGAYMYQASGATAPSLSPGSGTYSSTQTVTCTNPNSGTTVMCYTVNGTTPVTAGNGTSCTSGSVYSGTISIGSTLTLKIIAGTSTLTDSNVISYSYIITASPITYYARTDVTAQAYPGSIPCPGPSCSVLGTLTGAGFQINPPDFPITPYIRITDNSTPSGNHQGFVTACSASSETNLFGKNDDFFWLCQKGVTQDLFKFNATTLTPTYVGGIVGGSTPFVSYVRPYITYGVKACPAATTGCTTGDLTVFEYDLTGLTGIPTPTVTVDLTTACTLPSNSYFSDLSVSQDDQTFIIGTCAAGTCGQDLTAAVYMAVWNRTNGCSLFKTDTWQVYNNGVLLGSATNSGASFAKMHNVRGNADGTKVRPTPSAGLGLSQVYAWTPFTTTINYSTSGDSCGHLCNGTTHIFNKCTGTFINGIGEMAFSSLNTWNSLPASYPSPDVAFSAHVTCANANSTDTAPFFVIAAMTSATYPTYAWDNELLGQAADGSGKTWRFGHTYATVALQNLLPGAISQSSKYLLWQSDWLDMLGCSNGTSVGCGVLEPDWATGAYTTASRITPLTGNAGGYSFQPTGSCTASGSQPAWTQSIGSTSSDSGCTWTNIGLARTDVFLAVLPTQPQSPTNPAWFANLKFDPKSIGGTE